jgi:hypothetical protein
MYDRNLGHDSSLGNDSSLGHDSTLWHESSLGHDSQSILCYADADLGGEADTSKTTSGIVVYALGTLIIWKSNTQRVVAQLTMQAVMISTAYGKVQIDWFNDLTSEIRIARR